MITTSVKVDGDKALQIKLQLLAQGAGDVAFGEIVRSATNVWHRARTTVPKISRELERSIEVVQDEPELAANVGTRLFYAPWVHHGTKRIRANPFLFNAAEEEVPNLLRALSERMRDFEDSLSRSNV